ncbi:hypothetical protein LP415_19230 [Polaromonas sp. P1(28)-8]|nr:hypothetical protein LP415_19230 [Polaromonas sp. P1(28)-8]
MILSIESSLSSFKTVIFHEGLNVLLSDKSAASTDKQTRNSAGKTSLVEVIHFLYGADCDKDSLFRVPELVEHTFKGRLRIGLEEFTVERGGADSAKIFLLAGAKRETIFQRSSTRPANGFTSPIPIGKLSLATVYSACRRMKAEPHSMRHTHQPSGQCFPTSARRRDSGGLISPERQAEKQHRSDWQVNLSYLLGLDWQIPFEFTKIRHREKTLEELRKAVKVGALGQVVGTVAELRPQVTIAEAKAEKLRRELTSFEVHESYKALSRRAASAKTEMQGLVRRTVSLNENLEHLGNALKSERAPQRSDIQQLYAAAGIELPDVALRRFDEVSSFYASVVTNRRVHLEKEISAVKAQIETEEGAISRLDQERSAILQNLDGRGALDDFLSLQKELAEWDAQAAALQGAIQGRGSSRRRVYEIDY